MATPTLSLRRLDITALRSIVEPQFIDLPENGLVMVLGANEDTDGSSGSGKTTLVEAIAYGQGYSEFSATDLQTWSWLTDHSLQVQHHLDSPKGQVLLTRGKKASIRIGDGAAITSAAEVKKALQDVVGVRPEVLKALTYRPQKTPGLFLAMTDQEKKSFLSEVLGLQPFEAETERVTKVITGLERDRDVQKAMVERARAAVGEAPKAPAVTDVRLLEVELAETRRFYEGAATHATKVGDEWLARKRARADAVNAVDAQYRDRIREAAAKVQDLRSAPIGITGTPELPELQKRLTYIRQGIQKFRADHQAKLPQTRRHLQDERTALSKLQQNKFLLATAQKERDRIAAELAHLEKLSCPTCRRPWDDEEHEAKLRSARAALDGCKATIAAAENGLAQAEQQAVLIATLEGEVASLEAADPVPEKFRLGETEYVGKVAAAEEKNRNALKAAEAERAVEVAQAQAALQTLRAEHAAARAAADAETDEDRRLSHEVDKAQGLVRDLERAVHETESKLREVRADNRRLLDLFNVAEKAYQVGVVTAAAEEGKLSGIEARLAEEQDYHGLVRGFLGLIFDETLSRIADLTNQRLARIPNVQALTLRFTSEHETKSTGKLRQEIRPVVEKDGHAIPLKAGVSGGMFTAVELAVDLSLADVIAERTGVYPGWLILDEAFDGLDLPAKRACMELLREASETRLILVIDHATEMKEMFDATIVVRSRGGRSTIACS
jgi:DNA repair exonuclease SbcCD ATPase subunit